ncbi:superoxide dismutase family protein [Alteribacillus iranensis]|uniref:Superoxide dismutase [Cu-Zn] n=1 Tax=Alteribacillus iranensis TaxID=930128 RepID=A0A1I2E0V2_9BACI|nr:superoxide dismutase family protein [Alteribacillus iranensis]SFE86319.1 superoxide dismutase, Cu-Zn family [Alteribacillus iranensis]
MKIQIPSIILAFFVSMTLAGCGAGDEEKETADPPQEENVADIPDDSEVDESDQENIQEGESPDTVDNDNTSGEENSNGDNMVTVSMMNGDEEEIGMAEVSETEEGVTIQLEASNLPEDSEHGFHIHETGACEAPDFKSAGGHFNPEDTEHGTESDGGPHAGDLPNITTDENGEVSEEIVNDKVTLMEGEDNSLLKEDGTALVIHAGADDHQSQPSGDAGDRIACGVIEK